MSEQQPSLPSAYDCAPIVRPGANLLFFSWFVLLGLPLLMLFLIFSKHAS